MRNVTRAFVIVVLVGSGLACSGGGDRAASGLTPEGLREARLEAAMAGLEYSEDGVAASPGSPASSGDLATAEALRRDGEELLAHNRPVEAIRAFVAAVLTAPELAAPYLGLGRALLIEGRARPALGCFREAAARGADPAESGYWVGAVEHALGRLDDALASWWEVVRVAPAHGPTRLRLAALLYQLGDLAAARSELAAATAAGEVVPPQLVAALAGAGLPRVTAVDGAADAVIGPQVRVDVTGTGARVNETTAAALDGVPLEVVASWNDYRESGNVRAGVGVSLDGGATWTDQLVRPEAAYQCRVEGDPMTAVDQRTGTLWMGAIAFELDPGEHGALFVARKDPGAATFQPAVAAVANDFFDKCWMAAGPLPGQPDTTRLHVAHADGYQYSDDLGDSFSPVQWLGFGLGFLPRVGPGGELYIAYWNTGNAFMLRRSLDGGATFDPPIRMATQLDSSFGTTDPVQVPGTFRTPTLAAFAVDPVVGTLYCVYFDTTSVVAGQYDVDLYLTRSTDGGTSWSTPAVLDFAPGGDQFDPWIEVDDEGRLHLLFYDTRNTVQSDTDTTAYLDAYYAVSSDGGLTWSQHRLTPTPFSSSITLGSSGEFIGDYQGIAVAGGRVFPVYMGEANGTPAIYSHVIDWSDTLFRDGFESGDVSEWSSAVP